MSKPPVVRWLRTLALRASRAGLAARALARALAAAPEQSAGGARVGFLSPMHRLLVALLAALDAVLAAAGGIAVVLAPLTLLWVFGIGNPDWSALWPASAAVWHLGHLVPVTLTLPDTYLAATGIDPSFATFTLSLAPLAFAAFTALFAARSGARAGEAGAALTGWLSGSVVFTALTTVVALTSNAALVASDTWLSILLPSLFFVVPSFVGAVLGAWRVGDDGPVDAVRGGSRGCRGTGPACPPWRCAASPSPRSDSSPSPR